MDRSTLMMSGVAVVTIGLFTLGLVSTAAAQQQDLLCETYGGINEGDVRHCVSSDGLGELGRLIFNGTNRVTVAVRAFPNLFCGVNGWNELGEYVGGFRVTSEEGSVSEACIPVDSGACYDASPIVAIEFDCYHEW